jgi:hypothetical protein
MGGSDQRNHPALVRKLQACLRWRNAYSRHPGVPAAQRRGRARIRSERRQRRGRPKPKLHNRAGESRPLCVTTSRAGPEPAQGII